MSSTINCCAHEVDGEHTSSRGAELWACRCHKTWRQSWAVTKWRSGVSPRIWLQIPREKCPGIRRGCADRFLGWRFGGRKICVGSPTVQVSYLVQVWFDGRHAHTNSGFLLKKLHGSWFTKSLRSDIQASKGTWFSIANNVVECWLVPAQCGRLKKDLGRRPGASNPSNIWEGCSPVPHSLETISLCLFPDLFELRSLHLRSTVL